MTADPLFPKFSHDLGCPNLSFPCLQQKAPLYAKLKILQILVFPPLFFLIHRAFDIPLFCRLKTRSPVRHRQVFLVLMRIPSRRNCQKVGATHTLKLEIRFLRRALLFGVLAACPTLAAVVAKAASRRAAALSCSIKVEDEALFDVAVPLY
ncbi:hypothetical protein V2J09_016292 [Rumex salicifolius]